MIFIKRAQNAGPGVVIRGVQDSVEPTTAPAPGPAPPPPPPAPPSTASILWVGSGSSAPLLIYSNNGGETIAESLPKSGPDLPLAQDYIQFTEGGNPVEVVSHANGLSLIVDRVAPWQNFSGPGSRWLFAVNDNTRERWIVCKRPSADFGVLHPIYVSTGRFNDGVSPGFAAMESGTVASLVLLYSRHSNRFIVNGPLSSDPSGPCLVRTFRSEIYRLNFTARTATHFRAFAAACSPDGRYVLMAGTTDFPGSLSAGPDAPSLLYSTDGGLTWTASTLPPAEVPPASVGGWTGVSVAVSASGSCVLVGNEAKLYRSADGLAWTAQQLPAFANSPASPVLCSVIFAGTEFVLQVRSSHLSLFTSSDLGATWYRRREVGPGDGTMLASGLSPMWPQGERPPGLGIIPIASVFRTLYYGVRSGPGTTVSGNALTQRDAFLSATMPGSVQTHDFEDLGANEGVTSVSTPRGLDYLSGSAGSRGGNASDLLTGRYNTTTAGAQFVNCSGSSVTLTIDPPRNMVGFFATDVGDFPQEALVEIQYTDGSIEEENFVDQTFSNQTLLFWGIRTPKFIRALRIYEVSGSGDSYGIDDFMTASANDVNGG